MNDHIKKNLLDLNFQKHLLIASTAIVLSFTYFIGLILAFISLGVMSSSCSADITE